MAFGSLYPKRRTQAQRAQTLSDLQSADPNPSCEPPLSLSPYQISAHGGEDVRIPREGGTKHESLTAPRQHLPKQTMTAFLFEYSSLQGTHEAVPGYEVGPRSLKRGWKRLSHADRRGGNRQSGLSVGVPDDHLSVLDFFSFSPFDDRPTRLSSAGRVAREIAALQSPSPRVGGTWGNNFRPALPCGEGCRPRFVLTLRQPGFVYRVDGLSVGGGACR